MARLIFSSFLLLTVVSCFQKEYLDRPTFDKVRPNLSGLLMKQLSVIVVRVKFANESAFDVLTPLPGEVTFEQGMVNEAIVGRLKELAPTLEEPGDEVDAGFGPEDLIVNPKFINLLHEVISRYATEVADYQSLAKETYNGWLYVIDGRTGSSMDFVPAQDILGAFRILNGRFVENSYHRNSQYVVYSDNGFITLHEILLKKLVDKILTLNAKQE